MVGCSDLGFALIALSPRARSMHDLLQSERGVHRGNSFLSAFHIYLEDVHVLFFELILAMTFGDDI
jgi:hypothetical protein